jgi:hypothetical protein
VKRQPTINEPLIEISTQLQGFALAAAMTNDVVGIPLKRDTGEPSVKPHVERVDQCCRKSLPDYALPSVTKRLIADREFRVVS